jgi:hypothetical protein
MAMINRLGFNNKGVDHLVRRVQRHRFDGVLGINIGKNFDTPIDERGRRLPALPGQGLRLRGLRDGQHLLPQHEEPARTAGRGRNWTGCWPR